MKYEFDLILSDAKCKKARRELSVVSACETPQRPRTNNIKIRTLVCPRFSPPLSLQNQTTTDRGASARRRYTGDDVSAFVDVARDLRRLPPSNRLGGSERYV